MRVIFALLVLLNVAYLVYQQVFAEYLPSIDKEVPTNTAETTEDESATQLALRQESLVQAQKDEEHKDEEQQGGQSTRIDPAAAVDEPLQVSSTRPATASATAPGTASDKSGRNSQKPSSDEAVAQQVARASQPPGQLKQRLEKAGDEGSPLATPYPRCTLIGPFASKVIVESLASKLEADGIEARLESAETGDLPDYMVYVGPAADRTAARNLVEEFESRSVDSYLIDKGRFENAISLGLFTRQPFAVALRTKMQTQGFDAKIREIQRRRQGYHLRADLPAKLYQTLAEDDNPMADCAS